MKRIILIVTIALLPLLSACFVCRWRTPNGQTTKPVPVVSKFGNLKNLKDDMGRSIFRKPIREGFYVRYRVDNCKEQLFYAIGDRASNPKVSFSGYQEKISGAGITTRDGLNVTSGYFFDKSKDTVKIVRVFANTSKENAMMYLSEVNNYIDTNLLPLSMKMGRAKKVGPLPIGGDLAIPSNPTHISYLTNPNCWPCQTWPDCELEFALPDPTRATVICIKCDKADEGVVHVVCLAQLDKELAEYREEGCEHLITFIGIDARANKPTNDEECTVQPAGDELPSVEGAPATRQVLSKTEVKRMLTLPARAAIVLTTEYKINRH
jgi:hypothetical protein